MPTTDPLLNTFSIRPATTADLPALVALEHAVFSSDRLSARQFQRHSHSDSALLLVCVSETALLGDSLLLFRRNTGVARLYSLAVAAAARGRGVGSALLDANEDAARHRDCRCLRLEVRIDNRAARALYERHGYVVFGQRPSYYADGADALRYQKPLG
ncbi:MAG: GNAT family N-acetyltransferase [Xanthomonadales bacterium]|nr:GNAT family N-acetyltransferase [Xanthomonadales bacterium]